MPTLRSMITQDAISIIILMSFLWLIMFITIHYLAGRNARKCQCRCNCQSHQNGTKDKEKRS